MHGCDSEGLDHLSRSTAIDKQQTGKQRQANKGKQAVSQLVSRQGENKQHGWADKRIGKLDA